MAELGVQPESAYVYVDTTVIIPHTDSDVIFLVLRYGKRPVCKYNETLTEYLTSRYSHWLGTSGISNA